MFLCLVRKEETCLTGSSSHSLSPVVISGVTSASISRTRGEERLRGFCGNQKTDTKQVGEIYRFDEIHILLENTFVVSVVYG